MTRGLSQIYISAGDEANGTVGIRLFYKPLILLIWLGACVMAVGGALSMTDRRFRVGAPVGARGRREPAGQLARVPAPAE